jgi:hypothetical protein
MLGLPLGPLAASFLGSNPWNNLPAEREWRGYPARLADVLELETLCLFAREESRIDHYVARLKSKLERPDEALNELRVGLFFKSLGYRIVEWEPIGNNGKKGEYLISDSGGDLLFVEVKSPGWEGELDPEERRAGRKNQKKYIVGECRRGPNATWPQIRCCVTKAYTKFLPSCKNLLVIADDFRVPPDDLQMELALYNPHLSRSLSDFGCSEYGLGCFASSAFGSLGGVARFKNKLLSSRNYFNDCYCLEDYHNPFALKQLPKISI